MKAKVIILPTSNKSNIGLFRKELYIHSSTFDTEESDVIKQHLYLVDPNAKIKKGDWIYNSFSKIVEQAIFNEDKKDPHLSKIIATTDKSLIVENPNNPYDPRSKTGYEPHPISQLSEQSVKLLVDYYNNNGKMPDEIEFRKHWINRKRRQSKENREYLIVNSQGKVDITIPEERVYSRKEVIAKMHEYLDKYSTKHEKVHKILENQLDDWASKNL